eukprot:14660605-Ditylum_brightwellii.AAC.1
MPTLTRAATKVGESKDVLMKDNKTAPSPGKQGAEMKGWDDTGYKNGDPMKKRKVLPSLKDME